MADRVLRLVFWVLYVTFFLLLLFTATKADAVTTYNYTYQSEAYSGCLEQKAILDQSLGGSAQCVERTSDYILSYSTSFTYIHAWSIAGSPPVTTQCSDIGYDPNGIYPAGFCVDDGNGNPVSSSYTECTSAEVVYSVPACALQPCPDGSAVNTNLGETCPVPKQCWDQTIVYGDTACPDPPFICPDGSQVATQSMCSRPNQQSKTCWDNSVVPLDVSCPSLATIHCTDGSSVNPPATCPDDNDSVPDVQCADGSMAQTTGDCPSVNITNSTVNDSSTSTTVTNVDGTQSTTTEINLDGLNSRLDAINNSVKELDKNFDNPGFTGSTVPDNYTAGTLTYGGVFSEFTNRVQSSAIGSAATNLFTVTVMAGNCPVWSTPAITEGWFSLPAITIDSQCSDVMDTIWPVVQAVLLAVATFLAIRIGFL